MPEYKKVTELDAAASVADTALVHIIEDPSGTPLSKKAPLSALPFAPRAAPVEFDDTDLDSGILTITHAIGTKYVEILMWKSDDSPVDVSGIRVLVDTTTVTIDLSTYGTITGTWRYRVI